MELQKERSLPQQIDAIDDQIISLLERRFAISRAIGERKRTSGQALFDPERTYELTMRFMRKSIDCGLSPQMARILIGAILDQVIAERINPSLIGLPTPVEGRSLSSE